MADIEHRLLAGAEVHEPKGILGASNGQVYVADGSGTGAWTNQQSGGGGSLGNVVLVTSEADFPAPVGNVITLPDNTRYLIEGQIVLNNLLTLGNNVTLMGTDKLTDSLRHLSSSPLITSSGSITIKNLFLDIVNLGCDIFSLSGTGVETTTFENLKIVGGDTLGNNFNRGEITCTNVFVDVQYNSPWILTNACGRFYKSNTTPVTTAVPSGGSAYKVAGATSLSTYESYFENDGGVDNRLKYTGSSPKKFLLTGHLVAVSISNSTVCDILPLVNGVAGIPVSYSARFNTTDESYYSFSSVVILQPDDYVELAVKRVTTAADLSVSSFDLSITEV